MAGVKTTTPARIFSTLAVAIALLASPTVSHAKSIPSEITSVGDNTFSLTRTAKTGFTRDTDKLKEELQSDAAKYCAGLGKQLKVVDLTAKKPFWGTGYASATIIFKALSASELEQAGTVAAPGSAAVSERPAMTGDIYNDLTKLDDLRKKGILTEEEFQTEKKKILARSK